jgi:signal transduction histidine kinase
MHEVPAFAGMTKIEGPSAHPSGRAFQCRIWVVTFPGMGKMLDRLAETPWLPWLACVIVGVALVVLDTASHDVIALILSLAVLSAMLFVILNHVTWYSRATEAIGTTELRKLRYPLRGWRDWLLLALTLTSLLMVAAVYVFDLPHDLIMPLVASVMVPVSLRRRNALMALLASRQPAS